MDVSVSICLCGPGYVMICLPCHMEAVGVFGWRLS